MVSFLSVGPRCDDQDKVAKELSEKYYADRSKRRSLAVEKALATINALSDFWDQVENGLDETVLVVFPGAKPVNVSKNEIRNFVNTQTIRQLGVPTVNGKPIPELE
ncbi:MAG: hypothetical protein A3J93_03620 [Candidatus Magasanikbacteria bacterium RIFOXYC2_FULL_42_28]|uniref:Uncharacterized protein n=1 Tax=Candidatus Magasanikbacteria bacterium RIFOXYC2_FULL_42_28 TaxID=1798704 RepID=A0A1F6NUG7_9BACT|nr:MAG: hypothetical protein A3J93_03620 [Candidatus Magasanikbacteria bacterium RIFOXYC2_FULL_42_28]